MRELKCLRCGTMMEYLGTKVFQLGDASTMMGDWAHFIAGAIKYELYECPECGKAEMYRPKDANRRQLEVEVEKADFSILKKSRKMGF